MNLMFQVYRGAWGTWHELFAQASQFAASLGRDRVVSISHSADESDGVVTVWYIELEESRTESNASQSRLHFEVFRGSWTTWHDLFAGAADFASKVGAERVVSISHSEDRNIGVVTVWYWS